jgi:ABC-2 type transport system permease protein
MTLGGGRIWAIVLKEFLQMRRDRVTLAMMMGIPLIQLILFGFAIDTDPKSLPTLISDQDRSRLSRSFVAALQVSGYFRIVGEPAGEAEIERDLDTGEVQFVIDIPFGFARDLIRGERPQVLIEADATDPVATSNAIGAVRALADSALGADLVGPLSYLAQGPPPFDVLVHRRYNQEGNVHYNVVPGLMGVVLTMTMVIMTALAVTRERERGTFENLLVMPFSPFEVMVGKIVPYIIVGYAQVIFILAAARYLFEVPMIGSLGLLSATTVVFIIANLSVGFTISTLAQNGLQAVQMSFFFFLPSVMLSGFMFPFRGMPDWAQVIGEALPLTHFLRITRGILLKGNGIADITAETGALLAFLGVASLIALLRYRRTLD